MSLDNIDKIITADCPVNNSTLRAVAMIPTQHITTLVDKEFIAKLTDKDYMRIAVLLAKKGYDEGGCAIGGVVVCNKTGMILGKGHNRHVQKNRVYWHGETDAIQDAGTHIDFSTASLFTTLTPCSVCTAMTFSQSFQRLVIGNRLDGANQDNEDLLRSKGVIVDILEDEEGKALYAQYAAEKPEQDTRDWQGEAGVQRMLANQNCSGHKKVQ